MHQCVWLIASTQMTGSSIPWLSFFFFFPIACSKSIQKDAKWQRRDEKHTNCPVLVLQMYLHDRISAVLLIDGMWELDRVSVRSPIDNRLLLALTKSSQFSLHFFCDIEAVMLELNTVSKVWLVRLRLSRHFYCNHFRLSGVRLLEVQPSTTWKGTTQNLLNISDNQRETTGFEGPGSRQHGA